MNVSKKKSDNPPALIIPPHDSPPCGSSPVVRAFLSPSSPQSSPPALTESPLQLLVRCQSRVFPALIESPRSTHALASNCNSNQRAVSQAQPPQLRSVTLYQPRWIESPARGYLKDTPALPHRVPIPIGWCRSLSDILN